MNGLNHSRFLLKIIAVLTLALVLSSCKVQVYDLQPLIATTEAPQMTGIGDPTAVERRPTSISPSMTSTPPLHIAPTRIQEQTASEIIEMVMINGGSGWGIAKVPKGEGELVVRTTNGGANWKDVTPPQAIYFLDSSQAWLVYWSEAAASGQPDLKVWKTQDSGVSWKKIQLPDEGYTIQYFRDVKIGFVDNQIGWIFAKLGQSQDREYIGLYTTHDGGETWTLMVSTDTVNLPAKGSKNGAVFRNAAEGWVSGKNAIDDPGSLLWHTSDGGNTWERQILPPLLADGIPSDILSSPQYSCSLTPPKFVDFMYQYAWMKLTCEGGTLTEPLALLYWTYDSGTSWRVSKLPKAEGNLEFYGIYQGWYSLPAPEGSSYAYEIQSTANGGENWNTIAQTAWSSRLQFITQAIGWGVVQYQGRYAMVKTGDGGYNWEQIFPVIDP